LAQREIHQRVKRQNAGLPGVLSSHVQAVPPKLEAPVMAFNLG
jgi:hypothetical protein